MKKLNLLSIAMLFIPFSYAQITLTNSDFPEKNDSFKMSSAALSSNLDLNGGANHFWDYSSLTANSQDVDEYKKISDLGAMIFIQFGSFAPSRYQASYFKLNEDVPLQYLPSFLPITISDYNNLYRKSQDSLSLVGISLKIQGQDLGIRYNRIERQYRFPVNYGDLDTTYSHFDQDMNPIYDAKWRQKRQHITAVDGWGQISTPYGTFSVLRIKHTITEQDSIYATVGGFSTWLPLNIPKQVEYEWRANGEKNPILRIKANLVGGNEVIRSIQYRDTSSLSLSIQNVEETENIQVHPNPTNEKLYINTDNYHSFEIISVEGKILLKGKINQSTIDVSHFKKGSYLLKLQNDSNTVLQRFIKE